MSFENAGVYLYMFIYVESIKKNVIYKYNLIPELHKIAIRKKYNSEKNNTANSNVLYIYKILTTQYLISYIFA